MNRPLVIVPARGGSKRIPRKNVKPFLGVPILMRVVRELRRCDRLGDVIVSTDDDEIRSVALDAGASVPFLRSERTSGDTATLHQTINEVLTELGPGARAETVMCVLPTAVLLTAEVVARAVDAFTRAIASGAADSLISVQRFRHPIERALRIREDGTLTRSDESAFATRTQDLEPAFHDAGQFYLATTAGLLHRTSLMGAQCLPFELGELEAHDIDDLDDWNVAEAKYRSRTPHADRN
ncbi:MAG TPA: acylneuraminate cytidylyltransferase family protein [Trueperaceae bacterium]|nr:acylneuraminate cytidylyltransferase family protein [Trueperaceae bacterium]